MPAILGGRRRPGHGRPPFRVQFAGGLPRTTADDSCWRYTGRSILSRATGRVITRPAERPESCASQREKRCHRQSVPGAASLPDSDARPALQIRTPASSVGSTPACSGLTAASPARGVTPAPLPRAPGLPAGCPVPTHPLGDGPALLLAHRAFPPADHLGRLLRAAPDGRRHVPLDRLDSALYGDELALERVLLAAQRVQDSALRHRAPSS